MTEEKNKEISKKQEIIIIGSGYSGRKAFNEMKAKGFNVVLITPEEAEKQKLTLEEYMTEPLKMEPLKITSMAPFRVFTPPPTRSERRKAERNKKKIN